MVVQIYRLKSFVIYRSKNRFSFLDSYTFLSIENNILYLLDADLCKSEFEEYYCSYYVVQYVCKQCIEKTFWKWLFLFYMNLIIYIYVMHFKMFHFNFFTVEKFCLLKNMLLKYMVISILNSV